MVTRTCKRGNIEEIINLILRNYSIYYFHACKVKPRGDYTNNEIVYILPEITEGLFIVVLQDNCGGKSHTIGINIGSNIIYDYMETY